MWNSNVFWKIFAADKHNREISYTHVNTSLLPEELRIWRVVVWQTRPLPKANVRHDTVNVTLTLYDAAYNKQEVVSAN